MTLDQLIGYCEQRQAAGKAAAATSEQWAEITQALQAAALDRARLNKLQQYVRNVARDIMEFTSA